MPHRYVVEANTARRVKLLSVTDPTEGNADVVVIDSDPFPPEGDLPSTGDLVTVAHGESVIRGTVVGLVFLVEVDE